MGRFTLNRPAWVRGRLGTGASCPSCNLAREVATLPLVTRGAPVAPIPLGKLPSLRPSRLPSVTIPRRSRHHEPTQPFPGTGHPGPARTAAPTAARRRTGVECPPAQRRRDRRPLRHAHGL